jgi:hypothetical protein
MRLMRSGEGAGPVVRRICAGSDSARSVMAAFRDMVEVSNWLLSLLGANRAEAQQRRLLGSYEQMMERLLEMQDGAYRQLRGEGRSPAPQPRGTSRGELVLLGLSFPI